MNSPVKIPRVNADAFREYSGQDVIPLYRAGDGPMKGKRPLDGGWTKKTYDAAEVIDRCIHEDRNMGHRLSEEDLAIDVDPRRGGVEGFEKFKIDHPSFDESLCPRVDTGGGGFHLFMKKPRGVKVLATLKKYEGVEFKSKGCQVVCAGSVHPETFKCYVRDELSPSFDEAPNAPAAALKTITRPERDYESSGGGQYSPQQIANALSKLDPTDFRDHDSWLRLMMAAHHASEGDAREEFIAWSTDDPHYTQDAEIIGRRWDSLHVEEPGGITVRTFNKILADHGAANAQVAADATEDFESVEDEEDISWLEGGDERSLLDQLNDEYCAVVTGGRYRIMYQSRNQTGVVWDYLTKTDFLSLHENRKVASPTDPTKTQQLGIAWQQWSKRRTARGTTFSTDLAAGELDSNGNLNLWLDWATTPKKGDWSKFREMIRDDICAGDRNAFEYGFRWLAWKIQNPGELPGVAWAMRGNKGTGKGTLAETFGGLFGTHYLATSRMELIGGRFNAHLEHALFVFGDEALWSGDPRAEATIKRLITERSATYEPKGVGSYTGINRVALMLATNEDWAVPATEGERRYFVTHTADRHQCPQGEPNHPNRTYWNAIYAELAGGGREAFLHDLLCMELPQDWHPREDVPLTQELAEQKARGFKGITGFYFERLQAGVIAETLDDTEGDWASGALYVKPMQFWECCRDYMRASNPRAVVTMRALIKELRRFGWTITEDQKIRGDRYWLCPTLSDARARFEGLMQGKFFT